MEEQKKYGEMLLKMINKTNENKIQTPEQLIQALVYELTQRNEVIG